MNQLVSVIMPVFNNEKYLKDSIESILNQTYTNFEFIIVNDGSTDNSEEIIKSFNDKRIIYYKQENKGASAARNKALELAKGEFILLMDSDDISLPNRIELLKKQFISDEIGIVHSDMLFINENNEPIAYSNSSNLEARNYLRFFIKLGTPIHNGSAMIRKKAIENIRYNEKYIIGEDTIFVSEVLKNYRAVHIPEPIYLYRLHSSNSSNLNKDSQIVNLHTIELIEGLNIKEIITEVNWENNNNSFSKAYMILAYFLFKRNMINEYSKYNKKAIDNIINQDDTNFIYGMNFLLKNDFQNSLLHFKKITEKDHIVLNYIGECLAYADNKKESYKFFMLALKISPNYIEPIENLRSIGISNRNYFNNTTLRKYINVDPNSK